MNQLVSDGSGTPAASTDASLVNGWGLSAGPTTPWWVSDNGTNDSTLYGGDGSKVPLTVSVPGGPTGTVFNPTAGFSVSGATYKILVNGRAGGFRHQSIVDFHWMFQQLGAANGFNVDVWDPTLTTSPGR